MSLAELETAVRLKCAVCIVIYNDSAYSAEVHHFGAPWGFSPAMGPVFRPLTLRKSPADFGADDGAGRAAVCPILDPVKRWIAQGSPGVFVVDGPNSIRRSKPTGIAKAF